MGFWNRKQRQNNKVTSAVEGYGLFVGRGNGVTVTEDNIENIPSVKNAIDLICGSVSNLPINLYKETNGKIEKINDDRIKLFNDEANGFCTGTELKKKMTKDMLLNGISYSALERDDMFDVTGIYGLNPKSVTLNKFINEKGFLKDVNCSYTLNGTHVENVETEDMLVIGYNSNEGIGKGILNSCQDTLSSMYSEILYKNNVYSKGALPSGILETDGKLSEPTAKRLRDSWENVYSGAGNSGKTVILEEGLTYKPLSLNPNELGLNESIKYQSAQVEQIFNLPTGALQGDINSEQFLKYTINPILSAIESAINQQLLLEEEKEDGYYFRFDVSELLKASFKESVEAVGIATDKGLLTMNEGRYILDMKPYEKDYIKANLGDVYMTMDGKFIVPNTGQNVVDTNNDIKDKVA